MRVSRQHALVSTVPGMCFALVFCADTALAATVCGNTDFPGSGKPDIRSYRQVSVAHIDSEIALGEQAEQRGLLPEAYHHYDRAMRNFVHPDLGVGVSLRCANASDYARALDKLQAVAETLAEQSLAAGKYLGTAEQRRQLMRGMGEENLDRVVLMQDWGALEFYLGAYRYQDFQRQLGPYMQSLYGVAGAEVDFSELLLVINGRAADLQQRQQSYAMAYDWQHQVNDTMALLPEELVGLTELQASRAEVVKQIERNIVYYLDQEQPAFEAVTQASGLLPEMMATETALSSLKAAAKFPPLIKQAGSYKQQPWYAMSADYQQQIVRRAEQRGDQLMARQSPQAAQKYFSFAGLRDKRDAASALGRKQGDDFKKNVELQLKDGSKIFDAATDAEREQFDSETDALADELGL